MMKNCRTTPHTAMIIVVSGKIAFDWGLNVLCHGRPMRPLYSRYLPGSARFMRCHSCISTACARTMYIEDGLGFFQRS